MKISFLTIKCDGPGCDREFDTQNPAHSLSEVRAHAANTAGWSTSNGRDLCPTCPVPVPLAS